MASDMEGLIYKVQPYKENTRLLFIYTTEGKKTLIAQGVEKLTNQNRILAQYLTLIGFKNQDKSMLRLSEAVLIDDFSVIKQAYHQTKSAAVILEILDKLIVEEQNHSDIFNLAKSALKSPFIEEAALMFSIKIQKMLGYAIDLNPDGRVVKGISIEKGGLVYENESYRIDLDVKTSIDVLKLFSKTFEQLNALPQETIDKIKDFIFKYVEYHLQTTLKNLQ